MALPLAQHIDLSGVIKIEQCVGHTASPCRVKTVLTLRAICGEGNEGMGEEREKQSPPP